jgi:hypothetical protein
MADEYNRDDPDLNPERDTRYQEPRYTNDAEPDRGSGWALTALFLLVVLIALAFWGYGWGGGRPGNTTPAAASADPLNDMSGKSLTLAGTIQNVEGAHAFTMSSDSVAAGKQILVISRQAINELPVNVSTGQEQKVQVEGKVQKFDRDQLQRDFNLKLSDDEMRNWDGKNVLVADSIKPMDAGQPQNQTPASNDAR